MNLLLLLYSWQWQLQLQPTISRSIKLTVYNSTWIRNSLFKKLETFLFKASAATCTCYSFHLICLQCKGAQLKLKDLLNCQLTNGKWEWHFNLHDCHCLIVSYGFKSVDPGDSLVQQFSNICWSVRASWKASHLACAFQNHWICNFFILFYCS